MIKTYIQSDGTQYINPNLTHADYDFDIRVRCDDLDGLGNIISGVYEPVSSGPTSPKAAYLYYKDGTWRVQSRADEEVILGELGNEFVDISKRGLDYYVDDVYAASVTDAFPINTEEAVWFLSRDYEPAPYFATASISYIRVWSDSTRETLVFDGIATPPLARLRKAMSQATEPSLYDNVTGTYFTNAGTGDLESGFTVNDLIPGLSLSTQFSPLPNIYAESAAGNRTRYIRKAGCSSFFLAASWRVNEEQKAAWLDWFYNDLNSGVDPFELDLLAGDGLQPFTAEFTECNYEESFVEEDLAFTDITATLTCYDMGNIIRQDVVDLLLELGVDLAEWESVVDKWDIFVNQQIPTDNWGGTS